MLHIILYFEFNACALFDQWVSYPILHLFRPLPIVSILITYHYLICVENNRKTQMSYGLPSKQLHFKLRFEETFCWLYYRLPETKKIKLEHCLSYRYIFIFI